MPVQTAVGALAGAPAVRRAVADFLRARRRRRARLRRRAERALPVQGCLKSPASTKASCSGLMYLRSAAFTGPASACRARRRHAARTANVRSEVQVALPAPAPAARPARATGAGSSAARAAFGQTPASLKPSFSARASSSLNACSTLRRLAAARRSPSHPQRVRLEAVPVDARCTRRTTGPRVSRMRFHSRESAAAAEQVVGQHQRRVVGIVVRQRHVQLHASSVAFCLSGVRTHQRGRRAAANSGAARGRSACRRGPVAEAGLSARWRTAAASMSPTAPNSRLIARRRSARGTRACCSTVTAIHVAAAVSSKLRAWRTSPRGYGLPRARQRVGGRPPRARSRCCSISASDLALHLLERRRRERRLAQQLADQRDRLRQRARGATACRCAPAPPLELMRSSVFSCVEPVLDLLARQRCALPLSSMPATSSGTSPLAEQALLVAEAQRQRRAHRVCPRVRLGQQRRLHAAGQSQSAACVRIDVGRRRVERRSAAAADALRLEVLELRGHVERVRRRGARSGLSVGT